MHGLKKRLAAHAFAVENLAQLAADVLAWRKHAALPADSKVHELSSLCIAFATEGDEYQEAERLIVRVALDNAASLAGDTGKQSGVEHVTAESRDLSQAELDKEAFSRLLPKLLVLSETIDDMSDDQFGDWIDALPQEEFFEFVGLNHDKDSFKAALAAARQQAIKSSAVASAAS